MLSKFDFYTSDDIAEILRVNKMTIYRYIKAGRFEAYRTGKKFMVKKEEFDRFLEESKLSNK
jgi:putative molybdopterin biosynthesis protein